jgi:hypothetical protein
MGLFSSNISDFALACTKSSEAPFEISNLSSEIKRSVEGLFRRKSYVCAIAIGDDLRPSRAQITIPILAIHPESLRSKIGRMHDVD